MKFILQVLIIFGFTYNVISQSVGIGTTSPSFSAILDVVSSSQGMSIPRMTTAQRKAISQPTIGLLVFDLDKSTIYKFDGLKWLPMQFEIDDENLRGKEVCGDNNQFTVNYGFSAAMSGVYVIVGRPVYDVGNTLNIV